jgi:hypothetical protein
MLKVEKIGSRLVLTSSQEFFEDAWFPKRFKAKRKERKIGSKILHILLSCMIDLDYFTLETKWIVAWQIIVGCLIQSKNEIRVIGKAGFEKRDILCLVS